MDRWLVRLLQIKSSLFSSHLRFIDAYFFHFSLVRNLDRKSTSSTTSDSFPQTCISIRCPSHSAFGCKFQFKVCIFILYCISTTCLSAVIGFWLIYLPPKLDIETAGDLYKCYYVANMYLECYFESCLVASCSMLLVASKHSQLETLKRCLP